jgi:hypothetical protein
MVDYNKWRNKPPMQKYRVGFKWKNGEEEYIVLDSSLNSTELAENLKKCDKTGKLETVYVKRID